MSTDAASHDGDPADPRWILRIVAALAAVFVVVALAAVALRPTDPPVPSEAFGRQFVTACARTGAAEDRCRCAWERWQEVVPPGEQATLEDELADGADLPDAVRRAVDGCREA